MTPRTLIFNLLHEELDQFKSNLYSLLDQKISDRKAINMVNEVQNVVLPKVHEQADKLDNNIIYVIKESIKQNSNINVILEDGSEVTLRPKDSEKLIIMFDSLDESNQSLLLNRIKRTKTYFEETMKFCSNLERRH
tara:strand:- start:524 stop:931 length:408 start_codon:yes stop_codon:yes gene_type:complete